MCRFLSMLTLGLAFTGVQAEECSQLLSQGIYDIHSSASDLNTASSFSQWFCDKKFSSSEQAESFGASLGFPFKGVPVKLGLDSSSQGWYKSYSSFCANVTHDQSLQSKVSDYVQTVNPHIIEAFNQCLQSDGLHVWLERTYDPTTFRFVGRFNSPDPEISPTTEITTFDTGKNVSCSERPQKISKTEWRTRCTRTNDRSVTIVVNATRGPIRGGGTLDLPEIVKWEPPKFLDISGVIVTAKGKTTISQSGDKVWYSGLDDCCSYTFEGTFSNPQTVEGYQKRIANNYGGGPCRIDSKITIKINSTRNITVYENFIPGSHPPNNTCGVIDFNPEPVSYIY